MASTEPKPEAWFGTDELILRLASRHLRVALCAIIFSELYKLWSAPNFASRTAARSPSYLVNCPVTYSSNVLTCILSIGKLTTLVSSVII